LIEGPDVRAALRRLLGAEGPDFDCDICFALLDRYIELELADRDADRAIPRMRTHLEGCPSCREQHQALRAFLRGEPPTP
jgi:hypothetical protein